MIELPKIWKIDSQERVEYAAEKFVQWFNGNVALVRYDNVELEAKYRASSVDRILADPRIHCTQMCDQFAALAVSAIQRSHPETYLCTELFYRGREPSAHSMVRIDYEGTPYWLEVTSSYDAEVIVGDIRLGAGLEGVITIDDIDPEIPIIKQIENSANAKVGFFREALIHRIRNMQTISKEGRKDIRFKGLIF
jgi:hypothetical protein